MNKKIQTYTAISLFLIIIVLSFYFLEMQLSEILAAVIIGVLFGLSLVFVRHFLYFSNKLFQWPDWIYRLRFLFFGISNGIAIGSLLFIMEIIRNKDADKSLFIYIAIGIFVGLLIQMPLSYYAWKSLKRKIPDYQQKQILFYSNALWIDENKSKKNGIFLITESKCEFYDTVSKKLLLEKDIKKLNPQIKRNKHLPLIKGLILDESKSYIQIGFPYFWQKKIKDLQ